MTCKIDSSGRLTSWKQIAAYLNRDVRTAIRWEKERGLPIRRELGTRLSQSVYALPEELDAWMLGHRDPAPLKKTVEPEPPPIALKPLAALPRTFLTVSVIASACLLLVIGIGLALLWLPVPENQRPLALPLQMARSDYSVGAPVGLISADINGDGHGELITADSLHHAMNVLIAQPDGTFGDSVLTPIPNEPRYFALADFNGDGFLDVAQSDAESGEIHILTGDGTGSFRESGVVSVGGGGNKGIVAADFNGDGKMDIAVVRPRSDAVTVLLGNGHGQFAKSQDLPTEQFPGCIAAADLNHDGKLDLISCNYRYGTGSSINVYLGRGDGTFSNRRLYESGVGPLYIAIADLNGDGDPDIITANYQDNVSVLMGRGDGSFAAPKHFEAGRANTFVAAVDFDRDGRVDLLALGMHDDSLCFLRGNGDGTFQPPQKIKTGRYPDVIALGDFNGDGKLDVAVTNLYGNSISVFLNKSETRRRTFVESLQHLVHRNHS